MDWKPPRYLIGEPHAVELAERLRDPTLNVQVEVGIYLAVMIRRLAMAVEDQTDERDTEYAEQMLMLAADVRHIKACLEQKGA